jgi:3-carboxy-cis,cis-muconate cycloisomerase
MLAAMVQEHERGLGDWHAEWDTLPEICCLAAGALSQLAQVLEGLELDPARMAENLEATRGLILGEAVTIALGGKIGRLPAHHLVEEPAGGQRASSAGARRAARSRCASTRRPGPGAPDPANYVGLAETMVSALAAREVTRSRSEERCLSRKKGADPLPD